MKEKQNLYMIVLLLGIQSAGINLDYMKWSWEQLGGNKALLRKGLAFHLQSHLSASRNKPVPPCLHPIFLNMVSVRCFIGNFYNFLSILFRYLCKHIVHLNAFAH